MNWQSSHHRLSLLLISLALVKAVSIANLYASIKMLHGSSVGNDFLWFAAMVYLSFMVLAAIALYQSGKIAECEMRRRR
jgi:hypothetical protein